MLSPVSASAVRGFGAVLLILLTAVSATAQQQNGAIAGVVKDATGSVLPGVSVEAASPALIEKTRTVVSDETGSYRLIDLRPGPYTVTFSLTGFSTVRREGIQLTSGFTANVNAELRVGQIEEAITVSAASPIVDIQNVNQQRVMTREVLDSIPTGKQFTSLTALIPGVVIAATNGAVSSDVGGSTGMAFAMAQIHGGRQNDQAVNVNGMSVASLTSIGNSRTNIQDGTVEEYNIQISSQTADFPYGGIYVNVIPKQGANTYHGAFFGSGTSETLQADNLGDNLRSQGFTIANKTKQIADLNPSFGGPLAKDKLWFFAGARYLLTESYVGGLYANKDTRAWVYTPDTANPAVNDQRGRNFSLNMTYQASPKNRFTGFYDYEYQCYCHFGIRSTVAPESSLNMRSRAELYQLTWTSPVTNKLLVDAGFSHYFNDLPRDLQDDAVEPAITEQSTGLTFRSAGPVRNPQTVQTYRASVTYVTGGHAFKGGFHFIHSYGNDYSARIGDISYRTLNGTPNLATFFSTPYYTGNYYLNPSGIYAQDQWTVRHWTINAGIRYDRFTSSYDAVNLPPVRYLPVARVFPASDVLNWKDWDPRAGFAWDVFGNGKTAVKASVNRYVLQEGKLNTTSLNPIASASNSLARTWTDVNRDFIVQGDPFNPATNGELGPSPNNLFGKPITTLHFDPAWANGNGVRPYNWETSFSVQHELRPGLSVNGAYFKRIYGNFISQHNELVAATDYDSFCVTAPADARLPGGGGYPICGLLDIQPSKLGQVSNVRTLSSNYGKAMEHWDGFDLSANVRIKNGILLQGGLSTGKTLIDNCDVLNAAPDGWPVSGSGINSYNGVDSLQMRPWCHQESAWLMQYKFLGSYPLPVWGLQVSGTFQSLVPDPLGTSQQDYNSMGQVARYVATNAVVAPSLGRNLAAGVNSNVTLNLVPPGSTYGERSFQTDLRLAKTFMLGPSKLQGFLDMFNLFNANPIYTYNPTYGTTGVGWQAPQAILPGRILRLGAQFNF